MWHQTSDFQTLPVSVLGSIIQGTFTQPCSQNPNVSMILFVPHHWSKKDHVIRDWWLQKRPLEGHEDQILIPSFLLFREVNWLYQKSFFEKKNFTSDILKYELWEQKKKKRTFYICSFCFLLSLPLLTHSSLASVPTKGKALSKVTYDLLAFV